MPLTSFIAAVLALLLAPGPTNTLMGIAGAQGGLRRVARLLPAELLGYLTAILPLAYLGRQALAQWPMIAVAVKVAAAAWVMTLAIKLWRARGSGGPAHQITAGRVYLTTLLNPKALVFGLVLLPAPWQADFPLHLGLFCVAVTGVALVWGTAGRLTQLRAGGEERLQLVQRIASAWLVCVAISLVVRAVTA